MSDYYHYRYKCPYMSGTDADCVHCVGGCRIKFTALADCKRYLREYCAGDHWQECTIAITKTTRHEINEDIRRAIKEWTIKKRS